MLEWKRCWEMEFDPGFQLTYAPGDFQETILKGIELCVRPRGAAQPDLCQGVHQDIGGAVEKKTEVIGLEGVTRGTIRIEKGLVVLDEVFHPAACTIGGFVDE